MHTVVDMRQAFQTEMSKTVCFVTYEVMQLLIYFYYLPLNLKAVNTTQTFNMVQASPNGLLHCQNWVHPLTESAVALSLVSHLQIFD